MSAGYVPVQWNRHKRRYDAVVIAGIVGYLAIYAAVNSIRWEGVHATSPPILAMDALGSCAILLLMLILCIGPLCRLDGRFLPLLYNRRHLGVMTFVVALCHGLIALGFYHGFGTLNPLVSLLGINSDYFSISGFPFQVLGAAGLLVMFVMAATSHDVWLSVLSPRMWKALHMSVYGAYALLLGHVALGAMQGKGGIGLAPVVLFGAMVVPLLHLVAGMRERKRDVRAATGAAEKRRETGEEWLDAGGVDDFQESRARVVCPARGERIAVFRHGGEFSAVTNVCAAHQGGPLGEGKVIDGCITCPWHGWTYQVKDGRAPAPFTERVAVYSVRVLAGRVQVRAEAKQPDATEVIHE